MARENLDTTLLTQDTIIDVPLIELRSVSKKFQLESGAELKVLEGVNLALRDGDVVALLGPSGSGKSTCLRIMSGLIEPTSGEVLSRGKPLRGINENVALVFQSFALFPWETVYENIALALKPVELGPSEVKERVKRAIDLVGLEGFEEAYPRELSGGMKQRVGVARALVMERPVLFLDEPFSALDVLTADTLRTEIIKIFQSGQTPARSLLIVTHNIREAVVMAKRILVMGVNPGHVRDEILNDLSYPRDEDSVPFGRMVSRVHALITETMIPDAPKPETVVRTAVKESALQILPDVQISEVIGLLESIQHEGGMTDIFDLSQAIGKDFGQTLYLVKAAELLNLVDTPKQTVILTEFGKRFVEGDMNIRKGMLHDLFGGLRIVQQVGELLKQSETLRLPVEVIEQKVAEWLPNENPQSVLNVLISWGRFSEVFGYNDDAKELYLDVGQEAL
ncbi:MAG: nitrate ABC transporter ATP-binding protein [Acidobacteria bacterium]|nr:MAG: nitrate ABC transporter ATP-binding protein [Acidobacteriota bacterium]